MATQALITALYLAHIGSEVKVAHRREVFRAENALVQTFMGLKNAEVFWNTEITQIIGEKIVKKVTMRDKKSGQIKELPVDGVFIQVGEDPNSHQAKEAGVKVDENNYIVIDALQHTNLEGIYAAGDVTNDPVKQVERPLGRELPLPSKLMLSSEDHTTKGKKSSKTNISSGTQLQTFWAMSVRTTL